MGSQYPVQQIQNFEQLLTKEYISKPEGSTVADLKKAVRKMGLNCFALHGLGINSLRQAEDPLILHVASAGQLETYNHWMLFLGIENGEAVVVDSESGKKRTPLDVLLARWDGIALVVFDNENPKTDYGRVETLSKLTYVVATLTTVSAAFLFLSFVNLDSALTLFGTSFLCIFGFQHFINDVGLGKTIKANLYVQTAISKGNFPLVTYRELAQEIQSSQTRLLLIDARDENSFGYGCIPGATNIPVFFDDAELTEALLGVPRSQNIVIYCQSSGCVYDETLGIRLAGMGFDKIRLYREGWSGWQNRRNGKK